MKSMGYKGCPVSEGVCPVSPKINILQWVIRVSSVFPSPYGERDSRLGCGYPRGRSVGPSPTGGNAGD